MRPNSTPSGDCVCDNNGDKQFQAKRRFCVNGQWGDTHLLCKRHIRTPVFKGDITEIADARFVAEIYIPTENTKKYKKYSLALLANNI